MTIDPDRWYPVAASIELPHGHVHQTALGGEPLAVWRASDGTCNVWEDRCPHRGVRFSIGEVVGDELRCQYHAWRFVSGSGACTHIPAQPNAKPPAAVRARPWPVREQDGHVWTGIAPQGDPPALGMGEPIYPLPVRRDAAVVEGALPPTWNGCSLTVQPVATGRCIIRGMASGPEDAAATDAMLETLRRALEASA